MRKIIPGRAAEPIPILQPQSPCMIIFKQGNHFEAGACVADSASYFSILSVGFAKSSRIKFITCEVDHIIRMMDASGRQIPIVGYADVEIKTVWGNEYKATRMLIMEGWG